MTQKRKMTPAEKSVFDSLHSIAGQPNGGSWSRTHRSWCWIVTRRGRRAKDRLVLLVLADFARDLGLKVNLFKTRTVNRTTAAEACDDNPDEANAVTVTIYTEPNTGD